MAVAAPDFLDFGVPVGLEPRPIPLILLVQPGPGRFIYNTDDSRTVKDLSLRDLRIVEAADFRDGGFLLVGSRLMVDTVLNVLLTQALHRDFERASGSLV